MFEPRKITDLIGLTMQSVEKTKTSRPGYDENDALVFVTCDGQRFAMTHDQDCCESVCIEDICGDLADLVGSPITMAEEATNSTDPPGVDGTDGTPRTPESYTWTFYRIGTAKGSVTIRFYGESNGWYGETASLYEVTE